MNISLMGYMGAGKSTIGKGLAENLNLAFIDLDHEIENRINTKIPIFFKENGELRFRKLEQEILKDILVSQTSFVLSTGGGTPMYFDNLKLLNKNTFSIYLQQNVSVLSQRLEIQKDNRPLIAHLKKDELPVFIAKHLFEREKFYTQANYTLKSTDKSVEEIIKEIHLNLPKNPLP